MTQTLTVDKKTKTVKTTSKAKTDGATGAKTTVASGRSGLNTKYALAGVGADVAKVVSKVGRPVWAEISTSALTYNLEAIRKFGIPKTSSARRRGWCCRS